jgi:putative endonuclease
MYFTYILQSQKTSGYYIGYTSNIDERLVRHNSGRNRSTKRGMPWKLIHCENYKDKILAMRREREIKSYKGGDAFRNLIKNCI